MNKLADMFVTQLALQERIYKERLDQDFQQETWKNKEKLLYENLYFAVEELHEMGRELPYMKSWKTYPTDEEVLRNMFICAKKEYIDVVHFVINLGLVLHVNPRDFSIPKELKAQGTSYAERASFVKHVTVLLEYNLYKLIDVLPRQGVLTIDKRPVTRAFGSIIDNMLTIASFLHMDLSDIYGMFKTKNDINHDRQDNNY
jgi:dimeric dUTPase (all-alpha-NTP-PPase superfamily)